jgi:hypothetical protein
VIASIIFARSREAKSDSDLLGALGFNTCDGLPCFLGIVPGKTELTAGVDIISQLGNVTESRECYKQVVHDVITVQLIAMIPPEVPGSPPRTKCYPARDIVRLRVFLNTNVSLGTIVAKYGPPCYVTIRGSRITSGKMGDGTVYLLYSGGMTFSAALGAVRGIYPILPVSEIEHYRISEPSKLVLPNGCPQFFEDEKLWLTRPWLGFASVERYEQYKSADTSK